MLDEWTFSKPHIEDDFARKTHRCVAYCIADHRVPVMIKLSCRDHASWSFML